MTTRNAIRNPKFLVFDEMSSIFSAYNDNLKEQVRSAEGIPNAEFLVIDDKVFIFEKLLDLIVSHLKSYPDQNPVDVAQQLYPEAIVSAHEAVTKWNIVAVPYEKVQVSPDELKIRHRSFNAFIPRIFKSFEQYHDAMVALLLSKEVDGTGDFSFRNQNFVLNYDYRVEALPPLPVMQLPADIVKPTSYTHLHSIEFVDGFSPINKDQFDEIKQREFDWMIFSDHVKSHCLARVNEVWECTLQLPLESLNAPEYEIPEDDFEIATKLIGLYPELNMLTPSTLYELFDNYQLSIDSINWEAYRSEEFVFYLLSLLCKTPTILDVWTAYSLLQSNDLDTARSFTLKAIKYNEDINHLARNTSVVMKFLADNSNHIEQRGYEISTLADVFRRSRKHSSEQFYVQQ